MQVIKIKKVSILSRNAALLNFKVDNLSPDQSREKINNWYETYEIEVSFFPELNGVPLRRKNGTDVHGYAKDPYLAPIEGVESYPCFDLGGLLPASELQKCKTVYVTTVPPKDDPIPVGMQEVICISQFERFGAQYPEEGFLPGQGGRVYKTVK